MSMSKKGVWQYILVSGVLLDLTRFLSFFSPPLPSSARSSARRAVNALSLSPSPASLPLPRLSLVLTSLSLPLRPYLAFSLDLPFSLLSSLSEILPHIRRLSFSFSFQISASLLLLLLGLVFALHRRGALALRYSFRLTLAAPAPGRPPPCGPSRRPSPPPRCASPWSSCSRG